MMKNRKSIYILYGISVVILFLFTYYTKKSYILFLIYCVIIFPSQNIYIKHRRKEIQEMWNLANQMNLSTQELSKLVKIGTLDLESSKRTDSGSYMPSRKKVYEAINILQNRNNELKKS